MVSAGTGVTSIISGGVKSTVTTLSVEVEAHTLFQALSCTSEAGIEATTVPLPVARIATWNVVLSKGEVSVILIVSYVAVDKLISISEPVKVVGSIGPENVAIKLTVANEVGSSCQTFWFKVTVSERVSMITGRV